MVSKFLNRIFKRSDGDGSSSALGLLKRPVSTKWGADRGTPVDLYYIDKFMEEHMDCITGRVLEIKNRKYTERFGTGVSDSDVLDIDPNNPEANVIADLGDAYHIPSGVYDCFILTETLQYIYHYREAIYHCHRLLKPGGCLLLTVPTFSPVDGELADLEQWRFTENSCRKFLEDEFIGGSVDIRSHGNYYSCMAFLAGLSIEDLRVSELNSHSPSFVMGVCAKVVKATETSIREKEVSGGAPDGIRGDHRGALITC